MLTRSSFLQINCPDCCVETYAAIVAAEAKKASVPVCLHLDHGSSFELAMQAMHAGYTSVMIDGSKLDFEANIAETKRVADVARALDIPCVGF